jgi:hypothetical protein
MHLSTLKVSAVVLGAIFALSAVKASAIPMGPLPGGHGMIPMGPLPGGGGHKLVSSIPMGPLPGGHGVVSAIPMGPLPGGGGHQARA